MFDAVVISKYEHLYLVAALGVAPEDGGETERYPEVEGPFIDFIGLV